MSDGFEKLLPAYNTRTVIIFQKPHCAASIEMVFVTFAAVRVFHRTVAAYSILELSFKSEYLYIRIFYICKYMCAQRGDVHVPWC